jgi:hypothetical protein
VHAELARAHSEQELASPVVYLFLTVSGP